MGELQHSGSPAGARASWGGICARMTITNHGTIQGQGALMSQERAFKLGGPKLANGSTMGEGSSGGALLLSITSHTKLRIDPFRGSMS